MYIERRTLLAKLDAITTCNRCKKASLLSIRELEADRSRLSSASLLTCVAVVAVAVAVAAAVVENGDA